MADMLYIMRQNLVNLRIKSSMTSKDVAAYLHVTPACYSNYERGRRQISVELLVKLADLYQVSLDTLIRGP